MINEQNNEKITTTIKQIYQKVLIKKIDKIVAWQWINLTCLFVLGGSLLMTIFSFIVTYDPHFMLQQKIFLPLAIVFCIITLSTIILIILIKKWQKRLLAQIKMNLDQKFLINFYHDLFQAEFPSLIITDIAPQWTIKPTNLDKLLDFKVNDNIMIGQYHNYQFNLGSISQASTTVIDNLQPNLIPKPYNIQYYRYLVLTITVPTMAAQDWEIKRKNKYQKNNKSFDNFFWYDQTNKVLTPALKKLILAKITTLKMIPSIKVSNQTWSFQLATSSVNNSKDNYNSLFNLDISLNQKSMLKNILLTIKHDYAILQKSFDWFNLIPDNN